MKVLEYIAAAERRAAALLALSANPVEEGQFMGAPWVLASLDVATSDHNCGPDCSCWGQPQHSGSAAQPCPHALAPIGVGRA